ncbi:hypothetical protein [Sulfurovum sp. NBC37-1]|uniref:hypothetical protein n=1 Tax=Sulfurovum sp. (strain NBC37-1) TaxID=387093 RepID=UPI00015879B5|nr:hypothetical protein [Sulfurovum sp. NBC37-1]BAF72967.1 hypothetical protein SUN_2025 [Sulfurovum sp. NBC37-1]
MKQVLKVCMVLVLVTGILSSSPLTGDWQIDKQYTYKNNNAKYKDILGMTMSMLSELKISDNNTIVAAKVGLKAKLKKRGKHYALVLDERELPLYLLDVNHIKLIQTAPDNSKYAMFYSRTKLKKVTKQSSLKQSQVKFKLDRVYRTKIKEDYAFILLSKNRTMYFLQTDRKKKISAKEIKTGKLKLQKKQSGFTFSDKAVYELKNCNPYTVLEGKEVKIISSKKFKYRGNVYELQK